MMYTSEKSKHKTFKISEKAWAGIAGEYLPCEMGLSKFSLALLLRVNLSSNYTKEDKIRRWQVSIKGFELSISITIRSAL